MLNIQANKEDIHNPYVILVKGRGSVCRKRKSLFFSARFNSKSEKVIKKSHTLLLSLMLIKM